MSGIIPGGVANPMIYYRGGENWERGWSRPNTVQAPLEPGWRTLWPSRGGLLNNDMSVSAPPLPTRWEWPLLDAGGAGYKTIFGVTRDRAGAAIGNCTVKVLRVTDNVIEQVITSDATGQFSANVQTSGSYQILAVDSGILAGITDDNLTGT